MRPQGIVFPGEFPRNLNHFKHICDETKLLQVLGNWDILLFYVFFLCRVTVDFSNSQEAAANAISFLFSFFSILLSYTDSDQQGLGTTRRKLCDVSSSHNAQDMSFSLDPRALRGLGVTFFLSPSSALGVQTYKSSTCKLWTRNSTSTLK